VIGQSIQLEVIDGRHAGRYTARVQDLERTKLFIEIPLKANSTQPSPLPEGQSVLIWYRAADGAQCSFTTTVMGRETRNIPLLAVKKPAYSEIHRQQRREFLRVPISVPMSLVFMNASTKEIVTAQATGNDISGGGLSFICKKELPISKEDIIGFQFQMPIDGKKHDIVGKARVIRVGQAREASLQLVSLKFFEVNEQDRQRIVQYTFKRQLEMREKGAFDS
jgi:c-di-GMP-binding flagellar brake protein YcgR